MECTLCKLTFKVVQEHRMHFFSKKHKQQEIRYKENNCGIFVAAFPFGTTKHDIYSYFSTFGPIFKFHASDHAKFAIIVYEYEEHAAYVLSLPHFFKEKQIVVKKKYQRQEESETVEDTENELRKILRHIGRSGTMEEQIQRFVKFVTPCRAPQCYYKVIEDLKQVMSNAFSNIQVHPFGSFITKLQLVNSDIDLFVCTDNGLVNEQSDFRSAVKEMRKDGQMFGNIFAISGAKVPIIKCIHNETNLKCDISFKTFNGVKNSEFIKYYLDLDPNLRPVMLVIKYWAKVHELTGYNRPFTSYAMSMMFVFYLQQHHQFPSVNTLQKDIPPRENSSSSSTTIWNLEFSKLPLPDLQKIPMKVLLTGFFSFYSTFAYNDSVICPYTGSIIKKNDFTILETIPEELALYKKLYNNIESLQYDKPICLQDPFELNLNVCKNVSEKNVNWFRETCELAVRFINKTNETDTLSQLFTYKCFKARNEQHPRAYDPSEFHVTFKMGSNIDYLKKKIPDDSNDDNKLFDLWTDKIFDFLTSVLEKVLKFQLNEISCSKRSKLESEQDVHDERRILKYDALYKIDVTGNRLKAAKILTKELVNYKTLLEREIKISDYLMVGVKEETLFQCIITLSANQSLKEVKLHFEKTESPKKYFKHFCFHIPPVLTQWVKNFESEMIADK